MDPELLEELVAVGFHRPPVDAQLIADLLPEGGTSEDRNTRAATVFATMMGVLQLMRIETDEVAAERLMREGRDAAACLATRPW